MSEREDASSTASLMAIPRLPGESGVSGQDLTSRVGFVTRAGKDLCSPGVHHQPAVRLLIIADFHHVHCAFHPEKFACQRQRASPLPCSGFGGQTLDAGLFVVKGLRHRGVGLVAASRAGSFVLVINMSRGIERLFQLPGAVKRRRPPQPIDVKHLPGNINFRLRGKFLMIRDMGKMG